MDSRSRMSYLTDYLKKTEEFLTCLTQSSRSSRTQPIVLLSARKKLEERRACVEEELTELRLALGGESMELHSVQEQATERNKKARSDDHAPMGITNRKRSLGEPRGDSGFVVGSGLALSLGEDLQKMLRNLRLESGKSVIEWFKDGMGGAVILESLESMVTVVGKRLSTVTAEIFYLMSYGTESVGILEKFKMEIGAEAAESNIIKRRIREVILVAEHFMLLHSVKEIHSDLHDLLFKDALAGLIQQCSTTITDTESLLTLQNMPTSAELAREKLKTVIDDLRDMDDQIYSIELGVISCRSLFNAYSNMAQSKMDSFVSQIETNLDLLWEDLKERSTKRSRL